MVHKSDPDTFSYNELAIAGGMTKRAFQHLVDANVRSPGSVLLPLGSGIRTLKRAAVLGGFALAGVPLLAAARITAAVLPELNTYDGEVHSGLGQLARKLPNDALSRLPAGDDAADFWFHRELLNHRDIYSLGAALISDVVVEVVDKQRVYLVSTIGVMNPWDGQADKYQEIGRIEGWERGNDVAVIPTYEEFCYNSDHPEFLRVGLAHLQRSRTAYGNAVGRISVNLSLAIRNGLDRVARHRGML
ncbi:hypothetical protein QEZ47_24320 [Aminobacter anthyllidis]|uniref:hypothetical protein n=1 Tax=Aminobacter anthyllidis TaxID=1035067 RepID=UPI002455D351|nr:hypothetical protein [Aminobacter anthyllidis]MDH4988584.1 hypothetical protein [Aminobacter anthyllidis]